MLQEPSAQLIVHRQTRLSFQEERPDSHAQKELYDEQI